MQSDHYEVVPKSIRESIISTASKE